MRIEQKEQKEQGKTGTLPTKNKIEQGTRLRRVPNKQ